MQIVATRPVNTPRQARQIAQSRLAFPTFGKHESEPFLEARSPLFFRNIHDLKGLLLQLASGLCSKKTMDKLAPQGIAQLDQLEKLHIDTVKASIRDELTGLYNKRYFEEEMPRQYERARNNQSSLSVLMIDLDVFGHINKRYSALIGDKVLKLVASQLQRAVRTTDIPCRFGGEEFVIILPDTDREAAQKVAERILKSIAEITKQIREHPRAHDDLLPLAKERDLSASIGLLQVQFPNPAVQTPEDMLQLADHAANEAKSKGRNRAYYAQVDVQGNTHYTCWAEGPPVRLPEKNATVTPYHASPQSTEKPPEAVK